MVRHVTSADKLSAGMWFTSVVYTNELLERLAGLSVAKGTLLAREFTLSKLLIARSGHQTGTCKLRGTLPTCGVYLRSKLDISPRLRPTTLRSRRAPLKYATGRLESSYEPHQEIGCKESSTDWGERKIVAFCVTKPTRRHRLFQHWESRCSSEHI